MESVITTDEVIVDEDQLRPEEMIPYVREYLGLMDDKKRMDIEIKRCFSEFKLRRDRLLEKRRPVDERLGKVEEVIKKMIIHQKLPGVKYKQYIFTLDKKPVYKHPTEKIMEALENNPLEQYGNDKKALARIIADAIKKKSRKNDNVDDPSVMELRMRILNS